MPRQSGGAAVSMCIALCQCVQHRSIPIYELVIVEVTGGELADGGVHAVLHRQQRHRTPSLLEPAQVKQSRMN